MPAKTLDQFFPLDDRTKVPLSQPLAQPAAVQAAAAAAPVPPVAALLSGDPRFFAEAASRCASASASAAPSALPAATLPAPRRPPPRLLPPSRPLRRHPAAA